MRSAWSYSTFFLSRSLFFLVNELNFFFNYIHNSAVYMNEYFNENWIRMNEAKYLMCVHTLEQKYWNVLFVIFKFYRFGNCFFFSSQFSFIPRNRISFLIGKITFERISKINIDMVTLMHGISWYYFFLIESMKLILSFLEFEIFDNYIQILSWR